MANDVSYFKVPGDATTYSFNDADAENKIGTLETTVADQADSIAANVTNIQTNRTAIGTLSSLTTEAQGNLVAAVNEVDSHADTNAGAISTINTAIGSTALPTTAQTLTGAIAEHESDITTLNSKIGLNAHNEKNLGTSYGMVNFSGLTYNNNTDAFAKTTDGGARCKKAGVANVHAMVRMYSLTTGDTVGINVSIYRSGSWPYESYASTVYSGAIATAVLMQTVSVQANDILYICAANLTASRGKVSSGGTMWAEYV